MGKRFQETRGSDSLLGISPMLSRLPSYRHGPEVLEDKSRCEFTTYCDLRKMLRIEARGLAVEAVVCLFFISASTSMVQGSYHGSSTSPHFTVILCMYLLYHMRFNDSISHSLVHAFVYELIRI